MAPHAVFSCYVCRRAFPGPCPGSVALEPGASTELSCGRDPSPQPDLRRPPSRMENGGSWSEGTTAGQSCARPPAGKGVALEEGPASWPGRGKVGRGCGPPLWAPCWKGRCTPRAEGSGRGPAWGWHTHPVVAGRAEQTGGWLSGTRADSGARLLPVGRQPQAPRGAVSLTALLLCVEGPAACLQTPRIGHPDASPHHRRPEPDWRSPLSLQVAALSAAGLETEFYVQEEIKGYEQAPESREDLQLGG